MQQKFQYILNYLLVCVAVVLVILFALPNISLDEARGLFALFAFIPLGFVGAVHMARLGRNPLWGFLAFIPLVALLILVLPPKREISQISDFSPRQPEMDKSTVSEIRHQNEMTPAVETAKQTDWAMVSKWVWLATAAALVVAVLPLPYSYYMALRWLVFSASAYLSWKEYGDERSKPNTYFYLFAVIAVLYNPIITIELFKSLWTVINLGTAAAMVGHWKLRTNQD